MLTPTQVRELLATRGPGWDVDTVAALGEGDFCAAYLVNGAWVVRVAKHHAAAVSLLREAAVLPRLAGRFALAIPAPSVVRAERAPVFSAYRLVPGTVLTRARYGRLRRAAREACAAQIGRFLAQLHATEVGTAWRSGVPVQDYRATYGEMHRRAQEVLFPLISAGERVGVEEAMTGYLGAEAALAYRPVVLHGDLSPEHVLYDPAEARLTGIIDFGDLMIGDPAWDFVYLYEDYGPEMLGRVMRAYVEATGQEAGALLERVARHFVLNTIAWAVGCAVEASDELEDGLARLREVCARGEDLVDEIVATGGAA